MNDNPLLETNPLQNDKTFKGAYRKRLWAHSLTGAEIDLRKKQRNHLAYLIQSIGDMFYSHGILPSDIIITDEEGWVLLVKKCDKDYSRLIEPGICLSPEHTGRNGIGMALKADTPCKVKAYEHDLGIFHAYTSFGIPLKYNNNTIGAAGFIIPDNESKQLETGIMENVTYTIAFMAVKMLQARESIEELFVIKQYAAKANSSKALLALDKNLNILQTNKEASLTTSLKAGQMINQPLSVVSPEAALVLGQGKTMHNHSLKINTSRGSVNVLANAEMVFSATSQHVGWLVDFEIPLDKGVFQQRQLVTFEQIVGNSLELQRLLKRAQIVARSALNVLITGESGTGKELFAQSIHSSSPRSYGPFIAINSSAIPRELIESELSGYTEGAFTGARKGGMKGRFAQADGGTLFLDEIGDMPLELQPKLLRVIQEKQLTPLGSSKPFSLNIRYISATNKDINELIATGDFREDLYYRLGVVELRIPPLRERKEDIPLLANYFISRYCNKLGKPRLSISPAAMNMLCKYHWPGNIRELENAMELAVTLSEDTLLQVENLPDRLKNSDSKDYKETLKDTDPGGLAPWKIQEKEEIAYALQYYGGNIARAAKEIGMSRATFYRRIEQYDLLGLVHDSRQK